ncbi:MAG: JAB domain-containing protein [Clostridia bacterium]|nr:JAB domain-containing protein [Clostridia bacterium]MBR6754389.1 JAB domain-containing protein [Clostridia bacterium]
MSSSDKKFKENKYPHQGHRQRMRMRFENEHETMTDVDIVEMLLYYAVPRADTRKQAQALVDVFGSLEGIIAADFGEISKISGLKDSAETLFSLLREAIKRSGVKSASHSVLEPEKLKKYLVGLYKGASAETVYALYFSADGELVGKQLVFRGDVSSARFSLRTITEGVIRAGGNSVVLAHNHPSGSLVPSGDDLITTKRIAAHLAANDITLIEHYIVGNDDCAGILKVN